MKKVQLPHLRLVGMLEEGRSYDGKHHRAGLDVGHHRGLAVALLRYVVRYGVQ
jgi:hypothetical protein